MSQSNNPGTGAGFPSTNTSRERLAVVAIAESEVGPQDPSKYWEEVLPPAQQGKGFDKAWCGGFALWCLRRAGLARDVTWKIGEGFCEHHLTHTVNPQPGDIAYIDQPFQHHAIVAQAGTELVTTVDGNQAGNTVKVVTRPRNKFTAFYSIAPLLEQANA